MILSQLSPSEQMEQALFDLLHQLTAADRLAFALVEGALDPDGTAAQFFAACDLSHELRQARAAVERAQQLLAQAFCAEPVLAISYAEHISP